MSGCLSILNVIKLDFLAYIWEKLLLILIIRSFESFGESANQKPPKTNNLTDRVASEVVHLYVQRGEVAVQLFGVVDVRFAADGTHHVSDVFVSHGDGEVLPEALVTHGALTGSQRLHLRREEEINKLSNRCWTIKLNWSKQVNKIKYRILHISPL